MHDIITAIQGLLCLICLFVFCAAHVCFICLLYSNCRLKPVRWDFSLMALGPVLFGLLESFSLLCVCKWIHPNLINSLCLSVYLFGKTLRCPSTWIQLKVLLCYCSFESWFLSLCGKFWKHLSRSVVSNSFVSLNMDIEDRTSIKIGRTPGSHWCANIQ